MVDSRNPFSTRHTRPGAILYRFPDSVAPDQMVERLRSQGWWGQVIGPHGAGKTTLLHSLLPALEGANRQIQMYTMHAGERRLAVSPQTVRDWGSRTQVIVDGYEQMSWLARRQLKRRCRNQGAGLLVTTHRSLGLPLLFQVQPSCETMTQLVEELTREAPFRIDEDDVRRCFQQQRGDIREAFFSLYDLYEQRREQPD